MQVNKESPSSDAQSFEGRQSSSQAGALIRESAEAAVHLNKASGNLSEIPQAAFNEGERANADQTQALIEVSGAVAQSVQPKIDSLAGAQTEEADTVQGLQDAVRSSDKEASVDIQVQLFVAIGVTACSLHMSFEVFYLQGILMPVRHMAWPKYDRQCTSTCSYYFMLFIHLSRCTSGKELLSRCDGNVTDMKCPSCTG